MRIIIAGDGKVGLALTRLLSQEGHDLVTIDSNRAVLERDMQQFDVMTVVGNCATMATLNEAKVQQAEVLIAATSADEINLLCCLTARKMNPTLHTIARVRSPEYREQLYMMRGLLINGGVCFQNANDDANAYKYLAEYVETAEWPMFAKFDISKDENLSDIAYYATYYAYQNQDWAKAERYVKYAIKSPARSKDAQQLELAILGAQLKTHEDSVGYANKLEQKLAEDPENVSVFTLLVTTLSNIGQQAKADQIVEAALSKNPNNYGALVMKGQFESQKKNYEAAADALVKALPLAADDAQRIAINASIGQCYFYHAQEAVARVKGVIAGPTKEQFDKVYNKAIEYLLVAKNLDVNHESKRLWAYPLYGCYYFVKGEKAPETEAAAADAGISGE